MAKRGGKSIITGVFRDSIAEEARADVILDPLPDKPRGGLKPGQWPGAPCDRLPPDCPVVPLGVDGKVTYFIDSLGQLIAVAASEWGKKILLQLFARQPNYLIWAWPRFSEKNFQINGLEVDNAVQCLVKAAADRGMFSPNDRVRGRGAWVTADGGLIWHAGDRIFRVRDGQLQDMEPGEIDGVFYPNRPPVTVPWREPVPAEDSPVHELLASLRSWNWERPVLDPLLFIGWIGCAFLGGALEWRPHLYTTGDKGVGKSTLHFVLKELLGPSLHATSDTTAAGIYQRVQMDSLPVAIDELEADADNRRVKGVVSLARLASSGAVMYRGGAEHAGVEFALRNTFFMSGINPPPMEPADRSRLALLNLGKLDPNAVRTPPALKAEVIGRMILRQLMEGWPRLKQQLHWWKSALHSAGLDSRAQDTWGTLLTVAGIVLGDEGLEAAGLPIAEDDGRRVGALVAAATVAERADAMENWIGCLTRLFGARIDAWKGGEQPSVGSALEDWESGAHTERDVNDRLALVGLKGREVWVSDDLVAEFPELDDRRGTRLRLLAVPLTRSPGLDRLFQGTKWGDGVWASALKQGPKDVVIRHWGNGQNVRINRQVTRCLLIDLAAYDRVLERDHGLAVRMDAGGGDDDPFPAATLDVSAGNVTGGRKGKWPAKGG